jgi:hypothetical protein
MIVHTLHAPAFYSEDLLMEPDLAPYSIEASSSPKTIVDRLREQLLDPDVYDPIVLTDLLEELSELDVVDPSLVEGFVELLASTEDPTEIDDLDHVLDEIERAIAA